MIYHEDTKDTKDTKPPHPHRLVGAGRASCPSCLRGERPAISARPRGISASSLGGPPSHVRAREIAEFLTYLEKERGQSPHTVKAYGRDLEAFTEFCDRHYGGDLELGHGRPARPPRLPGRAAAARPLQAHRGAGAVGGAEPLSLPAGAPRRPQQRRPRGPGAQAGQAAAHLPRPRADPALFDWAEARAAGDELQPDARPRDAGALLLHRHPAVGAERA